MGCVFFCLLLSNPYANNLSGLRIRLTIVHIYACACNLEKKSL